MKKIYQISIIACVLCVLVAFASCADNDYKKACEEHDYIKAYQIVDGLEDNQEEARHYVILQEAMYALEQGDETGLMRIALISREHNAYWLYGELKDIAQEVGEEELAEKLSSMDPFKLSIVSTSIDGLLKNYFEVQDTIPVLVQGVYDGNPHMKLTFKKIKPGMPPIPTYGNGTPHYDIYFDIDFLNKDDVFIFSGIGYTTLHTLQEMNVGDITTIDFRTDFKHGACKFRVKSRSG